MSHSVFMRAVGAAALLTAISACNDPLALSPATFDNVVDTTIIYALRGTALTLPSGFDVVNGNVARTDRADPFDFAFDIADDGKPLLYPASVLGLSSDAALQVTSQPFDSVKSAPTDGFESDSALAVAAGDVILVRSRSTTQACALLGALPRYGKIRVLDVDTGTRAITLETLINTNCGYRSLEPGLPGN